MKHYNKSEFLLLLDENPLRFIIRQGDSPNAPRCPYGNFYREVVYDTLKKEYVRLSHSAFGILKHRQLYNSEI